MTTDQLTTGATEADAPIARRIEQLVAEAPPLSPGQRALLARILGAVRPQPGRQD